MALLFLSLFGCSNSKAQSNDSLDDDSGGGFKEFVMDIIIAIGVSIGCFIIGLIIWFVLWTFLVNVNVALCIGCIPYVLMFISSIATGEWVPAIIYLFGSGALVCFAQWIYDKMS